MASTVKRWTRREVAPIRQPLVITAGIVLLAAVVLVCVSLVAIPLWTVLAESRQFQPSSQCSILKDGPARHACYEKVSPQEAQHSVQDAKEPVILRSAEPRSD
jgi:hypothetical protein